jgi:ribose transport system permease protein
MPRSQISEGCARRIRGVFPGVWARERMEETEWPQRWMERGAVGFVETASEVESAATRPEERTVTEVGHEVEKVGGFKSGAGRFAYRWGILVAWAIVIAVFGYLRPDTFLTTSNFSTIFGSQAVLLILSIALMIPLTAGEYDLSVAGTLGISLILTQYLNAQVGWPLWLAIAAALAAGIGVGLVNAFFIIVIGVESIIVTLAIGTVLVGIGYGLNESVIVGSSDFLGQMARRHLLGIPLAFYYGLALTAIAWYVYARTPLGRYLYFVGSNRNVSRLSGIRVETIRTGSLVAAGFISAIGGVVLAGALGSSSPNVANNYLLPAFAAVFLGATAVTPGRFNPWGTFIGVYFLITGITGLELMGFVGWIEQVFYGGSLVIAVALSKLVSGRRTGEG